MRYKGLKPIKKTYCFAVEDIRGDSYLFDRNPAADMTRNEMNLLYVEIVEGVFYPIKKATFINDKKLVGYFFDEILDKEYKYVYEINGEFSLDTDMDWLPISKEILDTVL